MTLDTLAQIMNRQIHKIIITYLLAKENSTYKYISCDISHMNMIKYVRVYTLH